MLNEKNKSQSHMAGAIRKRLKMGKNEDKILELNLSGTHEIWDGKWYSTVLLPLLGEDLCNSFDVSFL